MNQRKAASGGIVSLFVLATLFGIAVTPGVGAAVTAEPTMVAADFLDADGNGLLDSVTVTWDNGDNLPETTSIVPANFRIGGAGGSTAVGCDSNGAAGCGIVSDKTTFYFTERASWTTGSKPTLEYVPGHLYNSDVDPAVTDDGPAAAHSAPAAVDGLAPLLTGLTGEAGTDKVYAFFSEDVVLSTPAAGQFPVCVSSAGSVDSNDISQVTVSGRVVTIEFDQNLILDDVNNDGNVDLQISFVETTGASPNIVCGASVSVSDVASNAFGGNPQNVRNAATIDPAVDVPVFNAGARHVKANEKDTTILLDFGVGLTSSTGAALKVSDLGYANNEAGGAGAITAVTHSAGSSFVEVTLDAEPVALDLVNDAITVVDAKIAGSGATKTFSDLSLNLDTEAPYIVSAMTFGDGSVTDIIVTLSEAVDSATCTFGDWQLLDVTPAFGVTPTAVGLNACAAGPLNNQLLLTLTTPDVNTGATFTLAYNSAGTLVDLATAPLGALGAAGIMVTDGALPLLKAAGTIDDDADGELDAIQLTYSEQIDFATFDESDFALRAPAIDDGYTLTGVSNGVSTTDNIVLLSLGVPGGSDSDYVFTIDFTGGTLADPLGNLASTAAGVAVVDTAKPVITSAIASEGGSTIQVTFSEGVEKNLGGALGAGDFVYTNNGAGPAQAIQASSHAVNGDTLTLTVNNAFVSSDLNLDRLSVGASKVKDGATNIAMPTPVILTPGDVPTIVSVETLDEFMGAGAETAAANGQDGELDALRVTFSEPVSDGINCGAFVPADWSIKINSEDAVVVGLHDDVLSASSCASDDDAEWIIVFDATGTTVEDWGTGAKPTLTYTNPGTDKVFALASGIPLPSTEKTAIDGAAPFLMSAGANEGDNHVLLTFSEPARGTGSANKFVFGDLTYNDVGAGTVSSIKPAIPAHTVPSNTLRIDLPTGLDAADMGSDAIGLAAAKVSDAAGNAALAHEQLIMDSIAPHFESIGLYDDDANGLADGILVTLSEKINDGGTIGNDDSCTGLDNTQWEVRNEAGTLLVFNTDIELGTLSRAASGTGCVDDDDEKLFFTFTTEQPGDAEFTINFDSTTGTAFADHSGNKITGAAQGLVVSDKVKVAIESMETRDADKDGFIDGIEVVFTEAIDDSTFDIADWTVPGYTITGMSTGIVDDGVVTLTLEEKTSFDTDADFTGLIDVAAGTLADLAGNTMLVVAGDDAVDGAGAVVVNINAIVGTDDITITFSEDVTAAPSLGDFIYHDLNGDGAAFFEAVTQTVSNQIDLQTDSSGTNLDQITNSDVANDKVEVLSGFQDRNGVPSGFGARLLDGTPADSVPPGRVVNLAVTAGIEELTLTWTAPAETDTSQYDIRIATTQISTATAFQAAQSINVNGLGDAVTIPTPTPGGSETVTVTGLTAGTTYYFALTSKDDVGNEASISNSPSGIPLAPDTSPPATITDLSATIVTGNSVTLSWTAPGDDGSTGTVAGYEIVRSASTITTSNFDSATTAVFTLDPATLVAAGATQTAIVTGLDAATTYNFAVRGFDEIPNTATGIDTVTATTTAPDTTAPEGTLVVTSATHAENVESANSDPSFSWSGLTDAESTISYEYLFTTDASETLVAGSGMAVTGTTKSFADVEDGTHYFHVLGTSQGGSSAAAMYTVVIKGGNNGLGDLTSEEIKTRSQATVLTVQRDGENNILSWTNTDANLVGVTAMQVWVFNSPGELLTTITGASMKDGSFTHSGANAKEDSRYLTTLAFGDNGLFDASSGPEETEYTVVDANADSSAEDKKLYEETWFIVVIIVALLLLLFIILLISFLARKGKGGNETEAVAEPEAYEDDGWSDESWEEPLETEYVRDFHLKCPSCSTDFHVNGVKPLETTCPGCGVIGTLD